MKKVVILILILGSFLYASIGKITALKGEVFAKQSSRVIKLSLGYDFEKDDIIYTKLGKAQLTFKDNTVITLGRNSKLVIEKYILSEKNIKKSKAKFRFVKGIFKTITGAIGKANHKNFKIKTKTATIGIRGTVFRVHVLTPPKLPGMNIPAPELENSQTLVAVDQGSVSVTNNIGKEIVLNVGEAVQVDTLGKIQQIPIKKVGKTGLGGKDKVAKEKASEEENQNSDKKKSVEQEQQSSEDKSKEDSATNDSPKGELRVNNNETPKILKVEDGIMKKRVLVQNTEVVNDVVSNINKTEDKANEDSFSEKSYGNEEAPQSPSSENDMDLLTPQPPQGTTQKVIYEDSYASMGYWENSDLSVDSTWIAGKSVTDPEKIINDYMINEVTASYSGDVVALSNGKLANGAINLNIDFGTQNINGSMNFRAPGEKKWNINISGEGSVFANGFNAELSTGENSEVENITGSLKGNYFGDNAQAVGGTFGATDGNSNSAKGAFEAVKTGATE